MSAATRAAGQSSRTPTRIRPLSAKPLGVLAVVGLVVAFSLSSTLVKRAESPGVLVAFWRMVAVSVVLWSTGRRVTARDVRQVFVPGVFFGLNALVAFGGVTLVLLSAPPNGDASLEGNAFGMVAMLPSRASLVVALAAALGAFIAWRHLPARSITQDHRSFNTERPLATVGS